jgi:hypothetical protein
MVPTDTGSGEGEAEGMAVRSLTAGAETRMAEINGRLSARSQRSLGVATREVNAEASAEVRGKLDEVFRRTAEINERRSLRESAQRVDDLVNDADQLVKTQKRAIGGLPGVKLPQNALKGMEALASRLQGRAQS